MSHTSEPGPPSIDCTAKFLQLFVSESKTARFETLSALVRLLHCLTWVNMPPTQMLVPTCSIARTVPLTIGVSSGVPEGKASAIPQAKSTPRVIDASSTTILLIPNSFFNGAEEKGEASTNSYVIISKYLNIYQYTTSNYLRLLRPHLATTSRSWRLAASGNGRSGRSFARLTSLARLEKEEAPWPRYAGSGCLQEAATRRG